MNRNQMYEYLESKGMYPIFVRNKKGYHAEFRLNKEKNQVDCRVQTDWGYIRHIQSIHLCMKEIVLEGRIDEMKVNINYKDIRNFEVIIEVEE